MGLAANVSSQGRVLAALGQGHSALASQASITARADAIIRIAPGIIVGDISGPTMFSPSPDGGLGYPRSGPPMSSPLDGMLDYLRSWGCDS